MNLDTCPIWGTKAVVETDGKQYDPNSTVRYVHRGIVNSTRTGGAYEIDIQAYRIVGSSQYPMENKLKLTTWLIDQRKMGIKVPKISSAVIENVNTFSHLAVMERANRLLRYIADQSRSIAFIFYYYPNISVESTDGNELNELFAITETLSAQELDYLFKSLQQAGLIEDLASPGSGRCDFRITPKGHFHLEELGTKIIKSTQGFVAMWFDSSMELIWENGIVRAFGDAGYFPMRIDKKNHNNKIDDEIIAEIRRSKFLVADFTHGKTGPRGGVYYEAGFAHGLNIPVIFTCRKDVLKHVHFDTRQYNHIAWETPEQLRGLLSQRISATIGDGPLKLISNVQ